MQIRSQGREDPQEKEMEIRSTILAWEIPRIEEPGGLQSMGLQRVRHDLETKHSAHTANAGDVGLIPGPGRSHRSGWQLSPCAPTTEAPVSYSLRSATREATAMRSLCTARQSRLHSPQREKAHT